MAKTELGADLTVALGGLIRGIVHEAVNPLGSILMNAELARASFDDRETLEECLSTIGAAAGKSGDCLRDIATLASSDNLRPAGNAQFDEVVRYGLALMGSSATRAGTKVVIDDAPESSGPLNRTACAVVLATLLNSLLVSGATALRVSHADRTISIESDAKFDEADVEVGVALRLARRLCSDHGGEFEIEGGRLTLRLSG